MGRAEWVLLLVLSVLWGGSFFFSKVALRELPPFTVVLCRVGLAAIVLNLVVRLSGQRAAGGRELWLSFAGMGLLNNLVPFSLIFWGQTQIASSLAAILNATTPLFTIVVAHLLTDDEKLGSRKLAGVMFGLVGVVCIIGPDALHGWRGGVWGQITCLGAALSYAFAGIYGRRFRGVPPLVTAAGQVTSTTLMMVPIVLLADRARLSAWPGGQTLASLVALGLLCTALAYVIYFRILARAGATNLLLVTFLIPVSAMLLGYAFLHERLSVADGIGMALIFCGLACVDGRLLRWVRLPLTAAQPRSTSDAV